MCVYLYKHIQTYIHTSYIHRCIHTYVRTYIRDFEKKKFPQLNVTYFIMNWHYLVTFLSNYGQPHVGLDVLTLKCVTWCEPIAGCQSILCRLFPPRAAITGAQRRRRHEIWMVSLVEVCHAFCKAARSSCSVSGEVLLCRTLLYRMSQRCSIVDKSADFAGHGKTWTLFCCRKSWQSRVVCGLVLSCWKIPPVMLISGTTWCCVSHPVDLGIERSAPLTITKANSTVHVWIEYVVDTTEVAQRDDVPWGRCVAQVALLEDQPDVDNWQRFGRKFVLVQEFG